MDNATYTLIAAPQGLADVLRGAATQWDAGADSMFRDALLRSKNNSNDLYVFSWGFISNNILPLLQEASADYPGVQIVFSYSFEDALDQADLERVPVTPP